MHDTQTRQARNREAALIHARERYQPFVVEMEDVSFVFSLAQLPYVQVAHPEGWVRVAVLPASEVSRTRSFFLPGYGYALLPGGHTIGRFRRKLYERR